MIPYIKFYLQLLCRILHCFSDTATERFSHSLMCFPKDTAIISYRRLLSWFQFSFVLFERYLLYFYTSKNLMNFWIHWSTSISWILCLSFNITKWFNWLILRQRIDPKFPNDLIDFFFNWFFFFVPSNFPKLHIRVLLIHYINIQFCFNNIFYFYSLVTILILKGAIGTILILNVGCAKLRWNAFSYYSKNATLPFLGLIVEIKTSREYKQCRYLIAEYLCRKNWKYFPSAKI